MEGIYEEAVRGFEVPESTSRRVRGLIRDALGLRITYRNTEFVVSVATSGVYGPRSAIGRSNSLLEAQSFAWAWITGPYGVVKDVRIVKTSPNTFGIDLEALVSDIKDYLTNR
jgi:hypothetical protein|nr:MAG TPA: hypothetical protein [Caudoviricetes sp.]